MLFQDLTGRLYGRSQDARLLPASQNLPEMVKLRITGSLPVEQHLQRQIRVSQDGSPLRGPHRSMSHTKEAGPGNFMLGDRMAWVLPYQQDSATPSLARYTVWVPKSLPHWLRWPLYASLAFLLIDPVRRYYQTHPLSQSKLPYLEALRGIACTVVVVTHFTGLFYPAMIAPAVEGKPWHDLVMLHRNLPFAGIANAGGFAVDVFFILSGFVLFLPFAGPGTTESRKIFSAILRRPVRLFGVMATVMVLAWFLREGGYFFANTYTPAPLFRGLVRDLALAYTHAVDYSVVFWTLRYELWGSFAIYLFAWLAGGRGWRWFVYPALLWMSRTTPYVDFVLGALLADVMRSTAMPSSAQWLRTAAPALFVLGLLIGPQQDQAVLTHGFHAWMAHWLPDVRFIFTRGYGVIGAFLLVSSLLLSPWLQRRFTHPWLNSLGRQSYSVYGLHEVLLLVFASWLFLWFVPLDIQSTRDFAPTGWSYHLGAVATALIYGAVVWMSALVLTAFVDEPFIRLSRLFASKFVSKKNPTPSPQITSAPTSPRPAGTTDTK